MCQILGMNCAQPTSFDFSIKGFCKRGGETDVHSHGFGLCLYQGRGLQSFHDTQPACRSPIAKLLENYPMRTYNMMAHIRYATQGEVSLENVHPFTRVWKGVQMCFCHNGECPKFAPTPRGSSTSNSTNANNKATEIVRLGKTRLDSITYHPVGNTDSEAVFVAILNALTAEFPDDKLPTLPVLHEFLSRICDEIISKSGSKQTIFNFLLGCGQYTLFAYSWPGRRPGSKVWNGLHYIVREPPFTTAQLLDVDYSIDFSAAGNTSNDRVAVITTKPLTAESGWTEFKRGELIMFDKGLPYRTPKCCEAVEKEGRGLLSRCFARKCCLLSPSPNNKNNNNNTCCSNKQKQHQLSPLLKKATKVLPISTPSVPLLPPPPPPIVASSSSSSSSFTAAASDDSDSNSISSHDSTEVGAYCKEDQHDTTIMGQSSLAVATTTTEPSQVAA